jgi:hypothetical protein
MFRGGRYALQTQFQLIFASNYRQGDKFNTVFKFNKNQMERETPVLFYNDSSILNSFISLSLPPSLFPINN